jgi:hypothetical protein
MAQPIQDNNFKQLNITIHIHPKLSEIDTLNGQNPCFIEGFVS